ncbi:hypothetical protein GCM10023317_60750 [Actinopolymorpha pittospori]
MRDLDEGPVTVGVDVRHGIAGLLIAMHRGCWDQPRACARFGGEPSQAGDGGENMTDPRKARVIAAQLRIRRDGWTPLSDHIRRLIVSFSPPAWRGAP